MKMVHKQLLRFCFLSGARDAPAIMAPSSTRRKLPEPKSSGFTLVELMVVIGMVVLLFSLAVPSFTAVIENTKVTTQTNELVSALNLARSEAIKRSVRVTVCKSADGAACTNAGDWTQGWIVFVDTDNDATVDAGEQVIRVRGALWVNGEVDNILTLTGDANVANYISYLWDGASYTAAATPVLQSGTVSLRGRGTGIDIVLTAGRVRSESVSCP